MQATKEEYEALLKEASKVYLENFPDHTFFERALFFSWGCTIGDCTFCYMSLQKKAPKETKRSMSSILAESIIAKHCGWEIGFFTGGIGVLTEEEVTKMLKIIKQIYGKPVWLSVGPVPQSRLERLKPYICGVVGSTETVEEELHNKVCPSKPLAPYVATFKRAHEMGLPTAMTYIVGMGEDESHFPILKKFIEDNSISKIHVYGLIPHPGTEMGDLPRPTKEYQAWWIAKLRTTFPKLDIQCGIWEDRIDYLPELLKAGANSISKLKALKMFNTEVTQEIEKQALSVRKEFTGTLTKLPDVNWHAEIDKLDCEDELKVQIKEKIDSYVKKMK